MLQGDIEPNLQPTRYGTGYRATGLQLILNYKAGELHTFSMVPSPISTEAKGASSGDISNYMLKCNTNEC